MKAYVKLSLENYSMVKMFSLGFSSITVTDLPSLCVWLLWLFEDWFVVYGTVTSDRLYNLSEIRITDTIYQKTRIMVSNLPDFGINIYIVLTLHVINKLLYMYDWIQLFFICKWFQWYNYDLTPIIQVIADSIWKVKIDKSEYY